MLSAAFDTVLVANRGEIAVRVVRACRDLGVRSVVAYSSADRDSLAVELADEAVCIGPGPAGRSYHHVPALLYACAKTGAGAVHPGYGFLSESAAFAAACGDAGIVFVGPAPEQIALMGDKIGARQAMRDAGLPVVPGSDGALSSPAEARAVAAAIGYPVVLKAAAGGGGRGITVVERPDDLAGALAATRDTARALFHDDRVYLERFLTGGRHVEVQVLADAHGRVLHLGERACSVQRRHQKLVEESPSPALDPALRTLLCDAAVAGARSIGYTSAGTFEFLVGDDGEACFIEMNTRLQVEHPVTELRTGVDLVGWMVRIAAGERLPFTQDEVPGRGHAIEVRVNAEDPTRDWAGSCGRVTRLRLPAGPGVRVDSHAYDGYVVPPYYDSLLAKVIVSGPDRDAALATARRALAEVSCDGVMTNVAFHQALLDHPAFRTGRYGLDVADQVLAGHLGAGAPAPAEAVHQ